MGCVRSSIIVMAFIMSLCRVCLIARVDGETIIL